MLSILVRSPNWIGDQVIARPFFHALRLAHPHAHIGAACVPWVADLQYRDLVDEVVVLPSRGLGAAAARLRAARRWDVGVSLPNSFSAAWMLFRAGARERIGYAAGWRSLLLNHSRPWPRAAKEHRAATYLGLLPPGAPAVATAGASFNPARVWPHANPVAPPPGTYWVAAQGSNAESRRWPPESFAALARLVVQATGMTGVVVGGRAEAPLAARLCADPAARLSDLTARGPASALWRVFGGAKFVVSNDSGLAHLAALCGAPVHVVWGGGDPDVTKPLGPGRVHVHSNAVSCWPCVRNTCSQPAALKIRCLTGTTSAAVWESIRAGFSV